MASAAEIAVLLEPMNPNINTLTNQFTEVMNKLEMFTKEFEHTREVLAKHEERFKVIEAKLAELFDGAGDKDDGNDRKRSRSAGAISRSHRPNTSQQPSRLRGRLVGRGVSSHTYLPILGQGCPGNSSEVRAR